MGHQTSKNYLKLQNRLNKSPQGAPPSDSLFQILEILFSEKEADLASKLPMKLITVKKAAKRWKKTEEESREILEGLADKGILLDMHNGKEKNYVMAPTMAGFFEFSIMRADGKFDRELLSKLYYEYINGEDAFVKQVLGQMPTIARGFVHEDTIQEKDYSEVLDYERASKVIDTASCITVGTCYCRHKMEHVGKACDQPQEVCLTFNNAARSLSSHGIAKKITKKEAHKVLDDCIKNGLVQIGDNVQDNVGFICNCCGCCCEALLAYKELGTSMKVHTNFFADFQDKSCTSCGLCSLKCPVDAIVMKEDKDKKKKPVIDKERCIGCGVCSRYCPTKDISMERRDEVGFVPKDSFERFVMAAINEGKLQNLIFDNFGLWTNDQLNRLLAYILSLKPVKRKLASQQLQSKYIDKIARTYYALNKKLFKEKKKPDYSHPELKVKTGKDK
ncbi:4Fe-4S binding protein [Candidatus Falkowbacteria bacterium]|jgi:Pyruvate/2-oxoacid:ferredoxin oxidoreductase delta subunit|nr:4Fe-4S binding protein [Candidatus Falkowbacteria bacterium]MBT7007201.1 4Fe-4S binding protein [Candidatus Falkowbacteria bacterium]